MTAASWCSFHNNPGTKHTMLWKVQEQIKEDTLRPFNPYSVLFSFNSLIVRTLVSPSRLSCQEWVPDFIEGLEKVKQWRRRDGSRPHVKLSSRTLPSLTLHFQQSKQLRNSLYFDLLQLIKGSIVFCWFKSIWKSVNPKPCCGQHLAAHTVRTKSTKDKIFVNKFNCFIPSIIHRV